MGVEQKHISVYNYFKQVYHPHTTFVNSHSLHKLLGLVTDHALRMTNGDCRKGHVCNGQGLADGHPCWRGHVP